MVDTFQEPRVLALLQVEEAHDGSVESSGDPVKLCFVRDFADHRKQVLVAINLHLFSKSAAWHQIWFGLLVLLEQEKVASIAARHIVSSGEILFFPRIHGSERHHVQVILVTAQARGFRKLTIFLLALVAPWKARS